MKEYQDACLRVSDRLTTSMCHDTFQDVFLNSIFNLLDIPDLLRCRLVCRNWNQIAEFVLGDRMEQYRFNHYTKLRLLKFRTKPPFRHMSAMCIVRNELFIFGGFNSRTCFDDTWKANLLDENRTIKFEPLLRGKEFPLRKSGSSLVHIQGPDPNAKGFIVLYGGQGFAAATLLQPPPPSELPTETFIMKIEDFQWKRVFNSTLEANGEFSYGSFPSLNESVSTKLNSNTIIFFDPAITNEMFTLTLKLDAYAEQKIIPAVWTNLHFPEVPPLRGRTACEMRSFGAENEKVLLVFRKLARVAVVPEIYVVDLNRRNWTKIETDEFPPRPLITHLLSLVIAHNLHPMAIFIDNVNTLEMYRLTISKKDNPLKLVQFENVDCDTLQAYDFRWTATTNLVGSISHDEEIEMDRIICRCSNLLADYRGLLLALVQEPSRGKGEDWFFVRIE